MTQNNGVDLEITQADREAAAENIGGPLRDCIREGGLDGYSLVQAFARHRTRHTPPSDLLVEALDSFLAKLDEAIPHIDGMCAQMANRSMPYQGPQFGEELAALKAALSAFKEGK